MNWPIAATLIGGLLLLVVGAEFLVRGAARLATAVGVSPLVVGLTVVAFGTSAPELSVSVQSAMAGQADLALGNVLGSNIFNVLFILGLSALITPLVVAHQLVRLDVPLMVGASIALFLFSLDGMVGRLEGSLLFTALMVYTGFLVRQSRRASEGGPASSGLLPDGSAQPPTSWLRNSGMMATGLAGLVVGSTWLVNGAVAIAQTLGVSELVIGLTVVAAGTSLPEVATSVLASVRGERDIAVGNAVGSNIFNILAVLGISSMVAPDGIAVAGAVLTFDMLVMIAVAVACLPIFFSGHRIDRWEGAVFLGYYAAYTAFLVMHATDHPTLPAFRTAVVYFALPLTLVTLVVVGMRARKGGEAEP